ncbi:MAG: Lrp/AsnC family transcriptional regulator [Thermoplasmata archaeon]|nr:Lrp/AsnC family transcriptional regulator [Thermoplasmata archaeon]
MPKTSKEQIKKDEQKIIDLLQSDAGQGIDSIAKKCGFSRQKVWRIIKRLEENGTLWGYTAVVDSKKAECERFIILIKRTPKPLNKELVGIITERKLARKAKEKLGIKIEVSCSMNGVYSWILLFTAPDLTTAERFSELIYDIYEEYISEVLLLPVIFPVKLGNLDNPNVKEFELFLPK